MLYALVEEVCAQIDALDVKTNPPLLRDEIHRVRPEFRDQVTKSFFENKTSDAVATTLATAAALGVLTAIKQTPELARKLVAIVRDDSQAPALRCSVASVLCYLVQPRDLIPDDAPGGYGFVDDAALVRAGYVEYLKALPNPKAKREDEEELLNVLVSVVPVRAEPTLRAMIGTLRTIVNLMSDLQDGAAKFMLAQLIENPLAGPLVVDGELVFPE